MKRQIRSSVFETNSSSTHSIAVPRDCKAVNNVIFSIGDFGWGWEEVDAADYLYTAIYHMAETESEAKEKIEKIKSVLEEHGIAYHFGRVASHVWHDEYDNRDYFCLDNGYIDHGYELKDFVDELLNDENKLIRFLSGGLVFTGNDNSSTEERCFISRDEEYLEKYNWDTHTRTQIKNPYYMSNHADYEWYYKGN
jgi:hypothetical protein